MPDIRREDKVLYEAERKKMGYRKISEQFKIGKTQEINCVY